jgi:hypothetical protein
VSIFGAAGRFVSRRVRAVTRTVKHVPVVGSVIKAGEGALKGPVGRTFNRIVSNPVVSTVFGPIAVPAHMAYAATTGGLKGVEDAAKAELRNPVRRAAVTALGAIFPPMAPAAVALNAANVALNAAESGKPEDMAKAAVQIGAAAAGADAGDPHMQEVMGAIKKAQALRDKATSMLPKLPNLHHLNAGWLGSTRANAALEAIHPDAHALVQPAFVQRALGTLHNAATLKPGQRMDAPTLAHAKDVVAHAISLGVTHPHVPFFADLAHATHKEAEKIVGRRTPHAKNILRDLEDRIMGHTSKRTAELNALVLGYNAQHPDAVAKVQALRTAHSHGDHAATAMLDDVRRRTAAIKKAHEYTVDGKGYARHAGAKHPAALPAGHPSSPPPKPPLHASGKAHPPAAHH